MSRSRHEGPTGFTLIELVIALGIVAALLAIMFAGLRVGLAAWRQGDARAESLQHARSLSHLLARVLSGAHPYRRGAAGREATQLIFEGDRTGLTFVTSTPPLPFPVPIAFAAVTLSQDDSGLAIRQKALPDRDPLQWVPPTLVDAAVTDVRFRYLGGEDKGWEDRWDGAREKSLPRAVEITLTTGQGARRVEQPPLVIALRVTAP